MKTIAFFILQLIIVIIAVTLATETNYSVGLIIGAACGTCYALGRISMYPGQSKTKYTFDYAETVSSLADYPFHVYSPPVKGSGVTTMKCIAMAHNEDDAITIVKALNNQ